GADTSRGRRPPRIPIWGLAVGAGLVAGVISGACGEETRGRIPLSIVHPPGYEKLTGYLRVGAHSSSLGAAGQVQERKPAIAAFGVLGLLLGISLGLVGGLAVGSFRSACAAAVLGGVAGGAAGWALSTVLVPLFFRFLDPGWGLICLFLTHAGIFGGVG